MIVEWDCKVVTSLWWLVESLCGFSPVLKNCYWRSVSWVHPVMERPNEVGFGDWTPLSPHMAFHMQDSNKLLRKTCTDETWAQPALVKRTSVSRAVILALFQHYNPRRELKIQMLLIIYAISVSKPHICSGFANSTYFSNQGKAFFSFCPWSRLPD